MSSPWTRILALGLALSLAGNTVGSAARVPSAPATARLGSPGGQCFAEQALVSRAILQRFGDWPFIRRLRKSVTALRRERVAAPRTDPSPDPELISPYAGLKPGESRVGADGRTYTVVRDEETGAVAKMEYPTVVKRVIVLSPGRLYIELYHYYRAKWRKDLDYYDVRGGLTYYLRKRFPDAAIANIATADEYSLFEQLSTPMNEHVARFSKILHQEVKKRFPGIPMRGIGVSIGARILLEHRAMHPGDFEALFLNNTAILLQRVWWAIMERPIYWLCFRAAGLIFSNSFWPGVGEPTVEDLQERLHQHDDGVVTLFFSTRAPKWWGWVKGVRESDGLVNFDGARGLFLEWELISNPISFVADFISHRKGSRAPLFQEMAGEFVATDDLRAASLMVESQVAGQKVVGSIGGFGPQNPAHLLATDHVRFLAVEKPTLQSEPAEAAVTASASQSARWSARPIVVSALAALVGGGLLVLIRRSFAHQKLPKAALYAVGFLGLGWAMQWGPFPVESLAFLVVRGAPLFRPFHPEPSSSVSAKLRQAA